MKATTSRIMTTTTMTIGSHTIDDCAGGSVGFGAVYCLFDLVTKGI